MLFCLLFNIIVIRLPFFPHFGGVLRVLLLQHVCLLVVCRRIAWKTASVEIFPALDGDKLASPSRSRNEQTDVANVVGDKCPGKV